MTFTLTTKELEKLLRLAIHCVFVAMEEDEMDVSTAMQIAVDTTVEMLREEED